MPAFPGLAAVASFILLQAMLGITAQAPTNTLRVMQPNVPPRLAAPSRTGYAWAGRP